METVSASRSYDGTQGVYSHGSTETGTDMTFGVYVPDHDASARLPVLWFLSGLTCTHANVVEKGEYRRVASELGLVIVAPDTSPRGQDVPDDSSYDMGQGAGFYVDATEEPWSEHFRMRSYIGQELPELIAQEFPVDTDRQGIFGHSMGGHGALTMALRNPDLYKSASAFSPIVAPSKSAWGKKALGRYLGEDKSAWQEYDACALIEQGARFPEFLVEQGGADNFMAEQLKPQLLVEACDRASIPLKLNIRDGYDHSYYFISTFMEDHLRWHADRL